MTKVATPKGNGKKKPENDSADEKLYRVLQDEINHGIKLIDAALTGYYEKNAHFPRNKKSKFFKWTIERSASGSPMVNVFFRENCLPYGLSDLKDVKMLMDKKAGTQSLAMMSGSNGNGNGALHALAALAPSSTSSSTLPAVSTYDEVGAPPSGPKEPGHNP